MLASAPPDRAGSASGILATARLVGQTFGAALVGLIFALTSTSPSGISHGATLAVLVAAGFAIAGAIASSLRLFGFRRAELPQPR
jgi:DHA2 family multidrug resistance protein-like MFS transporter